VPWVAKGVFSRLREGRTNQTDLNVFGACRYAPMPKKSKLRSKAHYGTRF